LITITQASFVKDTLIHQDSFKWSALAEHLNTTGVRGSTTVADFNCYL